MKNKHQFFKYIFVAALALAFGCKRKSNLKVPSSPLIIENILPICLEPKETIIDVNDIFIDENILDSVSAKPYLTASLSSDKKSIVLKENGTALPLMFYLHAYTKNYEYSIILKRSSKIGYEFKYVTESNTPKKVAIVGDFNGWIPNDDEMVFDGHSYQCKVNLNPGKYAYLWVVDNKWMLDPLNNEKQRNMAGEMSSVVLIDNKPSGKIPKLFTNWADGNIIRIKTINHPEKFFVLWDNFDLTKQFTNYQNDILEIRIPEIAANTDNSRIRVYSYNKAGVSNDILIPLKNGNVVKQSADLDRHDKAAMMMYYLLVDRFNDADETNNFKVKDGNVNTLSNFMGGDMHGIDEKIQDDYFASLGVNTLWLSPLVQNPYEAEADEVMKNKYYTGFHGYWPVSSSMFDARFGNEKLLHSIVKHAHHKEINVMIDLVSNHVHKKHPINTKHKDWLTIFVLADSTYNLRKFDQKFNETWLNSFLPDIDYSKPIVVDAMSDSALYWLQKYDIDGYRHGTTNFVHDNYWKTLTKKIKTYAIKQGLNVPYQIGEVIGSRDFVTRYVNSGKHHAQFDYNLYFESKQVFTSSNTTFTALAASLHESFNYFGWHSLMGNMTGNHDLGRFFSYGSDVMLMNQFNTSQINTSFKQKSDYNQLAQIMAFTATIPGLPVLFYGDEIGLKGAGTMDHSPMMKFEKLNAQEANQFETTKKLLHLRKNNMALIYGDFDLLSANENTLAYARYYFDNAAFVFFNKDNKSVKFKVAIPKEYATVSLKKHFNAKFTIDDTDLIIEMAPHSFEIITAQ